MNLTDIKKRSEAATPGPWHKAMPAVDDFPGYDDSSSVEAPTGVCVVDCALDQDATFIARARTDLPALVAWASEAKPFVALWVAEASLSLERVPRDSMTYPLLRGQVERAKKLLAELDGEEGA